MVIIGQPRYTAQCDVLYGGWNGSPAEETAPEFEAPAHLGDERAPTGAPSLPVRGKMGSAWGDVACVGLDVTVKRQPTPASGGGPPAQNLRRCADPRRADQRSHASLPMSRRHGAGAPMRALAANAGAHFPLIVRSRFCLCPGSAFCRSTRQTPFPATSAWVAHHALQA
jgi:hypothetical protein